LVKTINVVGCGKVGRTLARLWTDGKVLQVQSILNRSLDSSARAVEFVGGGRPVETYAQLGRADLIMISTSDEAIEQCCRELCAADLVGKGVIVFHSSGSLPSTLLEPAKICGASIAGVHPVMSFADPAGALKDFARTFCAIEGDAEACDVLSGVFERLGARTFHIEPEHKAIYHAGTVLVCNYLVTLMEVGMRCFDKAGVPRETARKVIQPIVQGTVDNIFRLGPARALTGPIARGEPSVIRRHAEALGQSEAGMEALYKAVGRLTVEISRERGEADDEALREIAEILR
jgi:predicted short-subunit dehydrogenase-like oxidoreductase (DUF2520 family)